MKATLFMIIVSILLAGCDSGDAIVKKGFAHAEKQLVIARNLQGSTMGKRTLRRKKTCLLIKDCTEEFVRRAQTLHKEIALSLTDHLHSLSDCRKLVGIMDYGKDRDIDTFFLACISNQCFITDEGDIGKT